MKLFSNLTSRQYFYLLAGCALIVYAIIEKDILAGIFSIFCLIQGIFNICLLGTCQLPRKKPNNEFIHTNTTVGHLSEK